MRRRFPNAALDEQEAYEATSLRAHGSRRPVARVLHWKPGIRPKAGWDSEGTHFDSPASVSLLEESTVAVNRPMMGVFNNLVMFKQDVSQNSLNAIVPDLATGWTLNEEETELTLPLRQGVKWHDGRPFTANDVKCTWDLLAGKTSEKLRINPRKGWYSDLEEGPQKATMRSPSFEAAADLLSSLAGVRVVAGLPLPRLAQRHAPASDWHRPVQICGIQAEPVDHGDEKSGLLETGPPLSRRDRMDDHQGLVDADVGFYRRQRGFDLGSTDPATEGHQEPAAGRNLRRRAGKRQPKSARQPRQTALRQPQDTPRHVAQSRSQSLY